MPFLRYLSNAHKTFEKKSLTNPSSTLYLIIGAEIFGLKIATCYLIKNLLKINHRTGPNLTS